MKQLFGMSQKPALILSSKSCLFRGGRDKLLVRIWTFKSEQPKLVAEAAEKLKSEPLFPETELLLFPEKRVLILLWRLKIACVKYCSQKGFL